MAWQISATGTREGVIKIVEAAKPQSPETASPQLEAMKVVLVAEINALPPESNGARVDASGDAQKNGRHGQWSVLPMVLAV